MVQSPVSGALVVALFLAGGASGIRAKDNVPVPCRAALLSPEYPRGASMNAFLKSLAPPASALSAKSRGAFSDGSSAKMGAYRTLRHG